MVKTRFRYSRKEVELKNHPNNHVKLCVIGLESLIITRILGKFSRVPVYVEHELMTICNDINDKHGHLSNPGMKIYTDLLSSYPSYIESMIYQLKKIVSQPISSTVRPQRKISNSPSFTSHLQGNRVPEALSSWSRCHLINSCLHGNRSIVISTLIKQGIPK